MKPRDWIHMKCMRVLAKSPSKEAEDVCDILMDITDSGFLHEMDLAEIVRKRMEKEGSAPVDKMDLDTRIDNIPADEDDTCYANEEDEEIYDDPDNEVYDDEPDGFHDEDVPL